MASGTANQMFRKQWLEDAIASPPSRPCEARKPMEEMHRVVDKFIEVAGEGFSAAAREFMDNHVIIVRDALNGYLAGTSTALQVVRRFDEFEREWGRAIADRVSEKVGERLKATPELRPWFTG